MTLNDFIIIFGAGVVITPLVVEAFKKLLKSMKVKYTTNVLVLIVSVIGGLAIVSSYYLLKDIPFNLKNIVVMVIVTFANWVGSMVGYDKVKQAILQITVKED